VEAKEMAKIIDPYKQRDPNPYDRHAKRHGGGDGLELNAKVNPQANQAPEDQHGPGYSNEVPVKSWVRGGAMRPGFDSGLSGNRYGRRK
jgi:hypothetical protein